MPEAVNESRPSESIAVSFSLATAVATVLFVGQSATNFSPFLLRAAMLHVGISEAVAAMMIAIEFVAFLVAALVVARIAPNRPAPVAMFACLTYALGGLCSAAAGDPWQFGAARLICGIGEGTAMAITARVMASHATFERLVAISVLGGTLLASIGLFVLPIAIEEVGTAETYIGLASVGFVAAATSGGLTLGARIQKAASSALSRPILIVLAAYLLSRVSDSSVWPFAERLGSRASLTAEDVGTVLAAVTVLALAAPFVAMRAPSSVKLLLLGTAILIKACTALLMLIWPNASIFIAAQALQIFALVMTLQLAMTWFADADPGGRVAIVGGVVGMIADATGPAAAGLSFAAWGLTGIVGVSLVSGAIGAFLLLVGGQDKIDGRHLS